MALRMSNIHVPIQVKGLVVGKYPAHDWLADISDDFSRLDQSPLGLYVPGQLTPRREIEKGVHLHWSLPDSLTKGIVNEADEIVYPALPDRWIVTRLWTKESKNTIQSKSWIIESTAVAAERNGWNDNSPCWPTEKVPVAGQAPYQFVGRSYPFDQKDTVPKCEYLEKLTVAGPGNPIYTAYYQSCQNIFGFYDDMRDEKGELIKEVDVSYCVVGEYRQDTQDVLHDVDSYKDLLMKMKALDWRLAGTEQLSPEDLDSMIEDASSEEASYKSDYHGLLSDIQWEDEQKIYQEKTVPEPKITIANASSEAIATLLTQQLKETKKKDSLGDTGINQRMLEHLLMGKGTELTLKDGVIKSEGQIHEKRFSSQIEETQYTVKWESSEENVAMIEANVLQKQALSELNEAEKEVTKANAHLLEKQEQIFDLWYAYNIQTERGDIAAAEEIRKSLENSSIEELQNDLLQKRKAADALKKEVVDVLGKNFNLVPQTSQRYWEPNDPVLLFSEIERSFDHGEDGRFSQTGNLLVRDCTASSLTVLEVGDSKKTIKIDSKNVLSREGLPTEVEAIIREAVLLSPNFAQCLTQGADKAAELSSEEREELAKKIEDLQHALNAAAVYQTLLLSEVSAAAGFDQICPEKTAVSYYKEPWNPLVLEWKTSYYQDKQTRNHPNIDNWKLSDGLDYVFAGKEDSFDEIGATLQGRTFLTSAPVDYLAEKAKELGMTDDEIRKLQNMRFLAQSLGGFNAQLLMHDLQLMPDSFELTEDRELADKVKNMLAGYQPEHPIFDGLFSPIRAGKMTLDEINIVDSFGQLMKIDSPSYIMADSMKLNPEVESYEVSLPPRITQAARLNVENLSQKSIFSWLVPNFFDDSLMVFSKDQEHICTLKEINKKTVFLLPPDKGAARCEFTDSPKEEVVYQDANSVVYKENGKFYIEVLDTQLKAFLKPYAEKNLLKDLLSEVNESLQFINPASGAQQGSLGMYLGRPIALLKGKINLELGEPSKKYKSINGDQQAINVEELPVKVWIGQGLNHVDGTIGFFEANNYDSFKLVRGSSKRKDSTYFSNQNYLTVQPRFKSEKEKMIDVTILVDPTAQMNIISGLLPVKTVALEENEVADAIRNLYELIFVAPILSNENSLEPINTISLPTPTIETVKWKWLEKNAETAELLEFDIIKTSSKPSVTNGKLWAREGWAKLSSDDEVIE